VAGRVRFGGLVPPEDVPAALWAADAVVHAGLREGLARALIQAGLCGRPVIAYDIGGAAEVVEDGVNGWLLAAPAARAGLDAASRPLAAAMRRMAADPGAARRMGGRWPPEVLARFDYRVMAERILEVYAEVLGSGGAAGTEGTSR
jgi:glycosyltransferase involved in cell wall biosynthesis